MTLVPVTPAAAGALPAPAPGSTTQTCVDDVKQEAARLAAAGQSGTATCVRKRTKQIDLLTGDAAVSADICGGSSTKTRIGACIVEDGILVIFLVPSGAVIGTIEYTVSSLTTLNYNSLNWTQSFNYRASYVSGSGPAVGGTYVYAEPSCIASCGVSSSGLIGGYALPGYPQSATAYFYSPPNGYKWNAQSGWKFWFANPLWTPGTSNVATTTPGPHRCDNALSGLPSGCVYDSVRPTLEIPSSRYPGYARHIELAINYYGMTSVLTRTQNETLKDLNYNTACPTGPNYPRPAGMSCDEYPFQSTYQGAYAQPYGKRMFIFNFTTGYTYDCQTKWLQIRARTDSGGYSSCMIPAAENSLGGSDLGNFYYKSRVLDSDQFQVRVT